MTKILLLEDDIEMCEILSEYLKKFSMDVYAANLPSKALQYLELQKFDLLILDLSLPEMDGLEFCKAVRAKYDLPIIISSARASVSDKVLGLELGADDYLPKPFDPRELVARIHAALRHRQAPLPASESNEFLIDDKKVAIYKKGEKLNLTWAEFEVLKLLIESPNVVLSRDVIVDNVSSMKWESGPGSVDVIMHRIRKKIGDNPKEPNYILSVKGVGYKFIG